MKKNTGQFTRERVLGEKNSQWKGDRVGYFGVHTWVYRRLGKPKRCGQCGSTNNLQWANISKKYYRKIEDWKSLCAVCHRSFDNITKLTKEQANEIKSRLKNGELQKDLALIFGVDQSTISHILHNKTKFYV